VRPLSRTSVLWAGVCCAQQQIKMVASPRFEPAFVLQLPPAVLNARNVRDPNCNGSGKHFSARHSNGDRLPPIARLYRRLVGESCPRVRSDDSNKLLNWLARPTGFEPVISAQRADKLPRLGWLQNLSPTSPNYETISVRWRPKTSSRVKTTIAPSRSVATASCFNMEAALRERRRHIGLGASCALSA
jgi:hypothetical protein